MTAQAVHRWRQLARIFLGTMLALAAMTKLANPIDFLASLYAYRLPLPVSLLKAMAVTLPWLELLCALLLLANLWILSALSCCLFMFTGFILVTGQAWIRGLNISCGCFDLTFLGLGPHNSDSWKFLESVSFAFFRNLALGGIVLWLWQDAVLKSRERLDQEGAVSAPAE